LNERKLSSLPRRIALAIVLGLAWSLAARLGFLIAGLSVMTADAPGATEDPRVITFISACWAFPVLAIIAALGGIVGAIKGWPRLVALTAAPPFMAAAVAVGVLMFWDR
jgi:hypothetical protein